MVNRKEIVFKTAQSARITEACKSVAAILTCLSVLCLVDFVFFHHAHGTVPWWLGLGFSVAAFLIIVFTKCWRLLFVLPLVGFFLGMTLLNIAFVLLLVDLEGAINSGDLWLVKHRIREGADVNGADTRGRTMLSIACDYWRVGDKGKNDFDRQQAKICEMVDILVAHGADVNKQDDSTGKAPLDVAAERKMYKVLELLLAEGANPNLQDHKGNSALHTAVLPPFYPYNEREMRDIIELLIRGGADVNIKNRQGKTPLQLIAREEHEVHKRMAELLRKHGPKE